MRLVEMHSCNVYFGRTITTDLTYDPTKAHATLCPWMAIKGFIGIGKAKSSIYNLNVFIQLYCCFSDRSKLFEHHYHNDKDER